MILENNTKFKEDIEAFIKKEVAEQLYLNNDKMKKNSQSTIYIVLKFYATYNEMFSNSNDTSVN